MAQAASHPTRTTLTVPLPCSRAHTMEPEPEPAPTPNPNPNRNPNRSPSPSPSQAAVLTDDFETARPLRTKAALRQPGASELPGAAELPGGADARQLPISRAALLERGEAGGINKDGTRLAGGAQAGRGEPGAAVHGMPEPPQRADGATRDVARERERRDELESSERRRVHLYVRAAEDDDGAGGRAGAPVSDVR